MKFMMELEEDRKLPFLDVLGTRGADKLTTTVYIKATHTDWYIHFNSNHHNRVKRGVIKCLKRRVTRIWKQVTTVFQQKRTLRSLLARVKGPQKHMNKGVVYQIPCAQHDEVYIGETGRPLKTRISDRKRAVATGDVRHAKATHWMKTNHNMDWGAAHVVVRSNRWKERKIKERVYIRTRRMYSMDSGSSLSPVWSSIIRHLEE